MELESILLPNVEPERPLVIAGPCSAETEAQVMETARGIAAQGIKIFRAGIWKPRTKPGCFEGVGVPGLSWLKRVKKETGMYVATEVANAKQIDAALATGIDVLWIGARTTVNPFVVQEIANALRGTDIPVLVKNPVNPDIELWIGALQRLHCAGVRRLAAIHRGFSSQEKKTFRNDPMWHLVVELRHEIPNLPILCDPSHIGGKRELVLPLAQRAMDLNMEGLMIETHCNPQEAWSDASQQLTPEELDHLLSLLVIRDAVSPGENLPSLRCKIDHIDEQLLELLAERMRVSCEIGNYKKEHQMPIVQDNRYDEIMEDRAKLGSSKSLDSQFVRGILKDIHDESVRLQMDVVAE